MLRKLQDAAVSVLKSLPGTSTLRVQPGLAGFFGEVFTTLNGLRLAELNRMRASVFWGAASPYFEAARGPNAWVNFFERADFDFSDGVTRGGLSFPYRPGAHNFTAYDGLSVRQSIGRALKSWCIPHPEIAQRVAAFVDTQFRPGPMLGVHVRLTDVAMGAEGRKSVGPSLVMKAVDAWLDGSPDGGIFLATDDQRAIARFEQRYSGRVVFQDCLRSRDGTSIHGHYDAGVVGSPYQKGLEVLVDALLLSHCHHLIRTHSRVTAFSLCWNLGLTYRDLEREILGIDRTPWLHS